jgi:hypothetical protein
MALGGEIVATPDGWLRAGWFRRWRVRLTVVAVLGLAIGLLIARPWTSPPLLAPVGVQAGPTTATTVRVSWQVARDSLQPAGFLVLRNERQVASVPGTELSYVDHGLVPGTPEHYTVVATSGGQRSRESDDVLATTQAPVPAAVSQTGSGLTTVTLTWTPPPDAPVPDQYRIEDSPGHIVATIPGRARSYTIARLSPSQGYQYYVQALWSGHPSPSSPVVNATTLAAPLAGYYSTKYLTTVSPGGGASLPAGTAWSDSWFFTPDCTGSQCPSVAVNIDFSPPKYTQTPIHLTLRPSRDNYTGTTTANVAACSSLSAALGAADVTDTISVSIVPQKVRGGAWTAWQGTMQLYSPPATAATLNGNETCPAQSWYFTVTGSGPVAALSSPYL